MTKIMIHFVGVDCILSNVLVPLAPFKSKEDICMGVLLKYDIITLRLYDKKNLDLNSVGNDNEKT